MQLPPRRWHPSPSPYPFSSPSHIRFPSLSPVCVSYPPSISTSVSCFHLCLCLPSPSPSPSPVSVSCPRLCLLSPSPVSVSVSVSRPRLRLRLRLRLAAVGSGAGRRRRRVRHQPSVEATGRPLGGPAPTGAIRRGQPRRRRRSDRSGLPHLALPARLSAHLPPRLQSLPLDDSWTAPWTTPGQPLDGP